MKIVSMEPLVLDQAERSAAVATGRDRTPLRLELSLAESFPWPGLIVRAAARINRVLVRLRTLQPDAAGFRCKDALFSASEMEILLVRTILSLPTEDGIVFRAQAGRFAPFLAFQRQILSTAGESVKLQQTERVRACRVLKALPEARLELEVLGQEPDLSVRAQPSYLDSEDGTPLGFPLYQDEQWMVFANAISPACEAEGPAAIREFFRKGPAVVAGTAAWDLVRAASRARGALAVSMPASLAEAAAAVAPRPSLSIELEAAGKGRGRQKGGEALKAGLTFVVGQGEPQRPEHRLTAEEILKAAAEGKDVLRRGERWCRVDAQTVERARQALQAMAGANGTPDTFIAREEEIPELLSWAKAQQADQGSPWNIYVTREVEGAHRVSDDEVDLRFRVDMEEEEGNTWFTLDTALQCGGKPLDEDDIERLMKARKKWLRKGGQWVKFDGRLLEQLREQARRNGFSLDPRGRFRFTAETREKVDELFSVAGTIEHSEKYRAFVAQLKGFGGVGEVPLAPGFAVTLRPYQQHGYNWLRFLARYGLNGILADDMGLGKTAQTLALLGGIREEKGRGPSLIVCPTSLVDNWCAEVKKFCPSLKPLRYLGSPGRRDRLRAQFPQYDLVLATYATVRNDVSLLKEVAWRYVILDEAHAIKNPAAAVTKAVKAIPSRHRLALTGTPVQNRLQELWSVFDFLMPGFLGRYASFFRQYEEPILRGQSPDSTKVERKQGQDSESHLRERIKPFVLRRLKTEVARELPEKIEQEIPCRLTADQVALYRKFAKSDEARQAVRELEENGAGRAQTEILAALTNLRKICNHPDLVHLSGEVADGKRIVPLPGYEDRSGKLKALGELIEQCREGGHRALLFSQQTSMLDIIEYFFQERGTRCLRLDGSTPGAQRQRLVDEFNGTESLDVFLISTRAGGSGLNLTGADTVIFYDHDWNPANDRQAQDRAYRIGQRRVVTVYRLVSQGTLEEKILERQRRKLLLADSIVKHDAAGFKNLTRDELLSLFTFDEVRGGPEPGESGGRAEGAGRELPSLVEEAVSAD